MVKSAPAIPLPQLREMVRQLGAKTRANEVNWARAPKRESYHPETAYQLTLPESRVVLTYGVPRAALDYVVLTLQNPQGETGDEWRVEEPDYDPDHQTIESADPDGDWRLLSGLFVDIHRQITGLSRVLTDVEKALATLGPIGQPAPK